MIDRKLARQAKRKPSKVYQGVLSAKRASNYGCKLNHIWVKLDLNCSEKIKKEQFDFGLRISNCEIGKGLNF
jgi:hypothetical protein